MPAMIGPAPGEEAEADRHAEEDPDVAVVPIDLDHLFVDAACSRFPRWRAALLTRRVVVGQRLRFAGLGGGVEVLGVQGGCHRVGVKLRNCFVAAAEAGPGEGFEGEGGVDLFGAVEGGGAVEAVGGVGVASLGEADGAERAPGPGVGGGLGDMEE